jgi:hypothetical protein
VNDDVHIGNCKRPQMVRKTEACVHCGSPVEIAGNQCQQCLEAVWWRETLARQRELVRSLADLKVTVVAGERQRRRRSNDFERRQPARKHLALFDTPDWAFCRAPIPGVKSQAGRKEVALDAIPDGVCEACREVLEQVMEGVRR